MIVRNYLAGLSAAKHETHAKEAVTLPASNRADASEGGHPCLPVNDGSHQEPEAGERGNGEDEHSRIVPKMTLFEGYFSLPKHTHRLEIGPKGPRQAKFYTDLPLKDNVSLKRAWNSLAARRANPQHLTERHQPEPASAAGRGFGAS